MRYLQQKGEKDEKKAEVELDVKDKRILSALSLNARTPATALAKGIGLSRDAVSYRINNLAEKCVILGFRTVLDLKRLGYDSYHVFLRLQMPSREVEEKLIRKFVGYPFMVAVLKFSGRYDIELALISKDVREFDGIFGTIMDDCSGYVQDFDVVTISKLLKSNILPKSFFPSKKGIGIDYGGRKLDDKKVGEVGKVREVRGNIINIDDKDREILNLISNDASMKLHKIASRVNLSADTITYRIKRMIREGIILSFVPFVNYIALGYSVYALLLRVNNLSGKNELKLRQFMNHDENVIWAVKTVGRYNVLIYLCVKNTFDLHKSIMALRNYFPGDIKDVETLVAYEEYKYTYFPECVKSRGEKE